MGGIAIVDGHPGAGKTTLIQRLLESNKSRSIQASRCLAKPHSGTWKEEQLRVSGKTASRHKELRRYLDAGASDSTLLTYDPGKTDIYSLLSQADAGLGAWDEWVLEAENDGYSGAHCSVFVLRPLAESARLVERKERIVCHIPLEEYLRHAGVKLLPGESLKPLGHLSEDVDID